MLWPLLRAIILLPGTVLVFVPAAILFLTFDTRFGSQFIPPASPQFWIGVIFASLGLVLMVWTASLFMRFGKGTPAPWQPPQKLVIRGPYRHVRNPMISGVLLMLLTESLLFQSWPLAAWLILFFLGNAVYFPLVDVGSSHSTRIMPQRSPDWGASVNSTGRPAWRVTISFAVSGKSRRPRLPVLSGGFWSRRNETVPRSRRRIK